MSLDFILDISDPYNILQRSDLEFLTSKTLEAADRSGRSKISLAIVSDEEIAKLNRDYRQKDKPTDVLSFPFLFRDDFPRNPSEDTEDLGEILIAHGVSRNQAEQKGHSLAKEANILYVHGLLHLLGYDHEIDSEQSEMETLENKILNS